MLPSTALPQHQVATGGRSIDLIEVIELFRGWRSTIVNFVGSDAVNDESAILLHTETEKAPRNRKGSRSLRIFQRFLSNLLLYDFESKNGKTIVNGVGNVGDIGSG